MGAKFALNKNKNELFRYLLDEVEKLVKARFFSQVVTDIIIQ